MNSIPHCLDYLISIFFATYSRTVAIGLRCGIFIKSIINKNKHHCKHELDLMIDPDKIYISTNDLDIYGKYHEVPYGLISCIKEKNIVFYKSDNSESKGIVYVRLFTTKFLLSNFCETNNWYEKQKPEYNSIIFNYHCIIKMHKNCDSECVVSLIKYMSLCRNKNTIYLLIWLIYLHLVDKDFLFNKPFKDSIYWNYSLTHEIAEASIRNGSIRISKDPKKYFTQNQLLMISILSNDYDLLKWLLVTKKKMK